MRNICAFFAILIAAMSALSVRSATHSQHFTNQLTAEPQQLISQKLQIMWPNTRVGAVSVAGNFALADWWLAEKAGRALLQKDEASGQWQVILCGGDALLDGAFLAEVGVTAADSLAKTHLDAEAGLSAKEKAALGSMLKPMRFTPEHRQHGHKAD